MSPDLVLIEGPTGIGNSRLVDELVMRAAPARVRVLAARGAHLEQRPGAAFATIDSAANASTSRTTKR